MRRRDGFHVERLDQAVEPLAVVPHVRPLCPPQRQVGEHRGGILQIERDRLLGDQAAVAVLVIVAVGKAVAGEEHAVARFQAPPGRAQIAHHRLDGPEAAAAKVDLVALLHPAHAVFVLRERQVIVAHVAAQHRLRIARQNAAEPAAMRGLLMRDEEIFQRRLASQQLGELPLDDREVLRVAGFNQHRCGPADDQEGGVATMIDLALLALLQALAQPENAGCDLARQRVGSVEGALMTRCHYLSSSRPT
jgi:hypothetical protein